MADGNGVTWRELTDKGCAFGKSVAKDLERVEESMDEVKKKVDRLTWALALAAVSFGSAAVMLAINLMV